MAPLHSSTDLREAVGVFLDEHSYQKAIDELLSSGFDHADISVLAAESTIQHKLANTYTQTTDLADSRESEVERRHYVATESVGGAKGAIIGGLVYVGAMVAAGPVIVAGGTIALAITAAAVAGGAGGVIGSVLSSWLGNSEGKHLQVQLENGGLLLWVHTRDAAHESLAVNIMEKHSGQDVHLHSLPIQRETAQRAQFEFQPPLSP
jgi:outer membrane lipoprotein SlyB